ncbi:transglycosylase SLT domain-containing protein [Salinibacterium sp. PAMC 21357]|uniref:aggregation-promoting factor C-terminal-like domain-containing protein n=1 Tax=Salinibacterium sp. PAMC 21357 TaxID=1112215 RepID=UPI0002F12B3B|nr:transglycosylase SLT domain-containing protein [Salinibacterium sp. PAMC 21357]
MVKNSRAAILRAQAKSQSADLSGRHKRSSWSLPVFASLASLGFVAAFMVVPPNPVTTVSAASVPATTIERAEVQSITIAEGFVNEISRDKFAIKEIVVEPVLPDAPTAPTAPAAGVPDPGTAQAIAQSILASQGMGAAEYNCLVSLWNRESGWNVYAMNSSSGAYGIPQALPGSKMASAGADWATNPATQISWGLSYIAGRYGTPCGAWAYSESHGWY